MPAYYKLNVTQLRQLCDERGIEHAGLTKKQIIQSLMSHSSRTKGPLMRVMIWGMRLPSTLMRWPTRYGDDMYVVNDPGVTGAVGGESEIVATLRLRLELAQEDKRPESELGKLKKNDNAS